MHLNLVRGSEIWNWMAAVFSFAASARGAFKGLDKVLNTIRSSQFDIKSPIKWGLCLGHPSLGGHDFTSEKKSREQKLRNDEVHWHVYMVNS